MWCNHNNPTIKQSQTIAVQAWKSCLQLTNLNLNHFKMVEDMPLKIIASRSPWMALPPYQISWKSTKRFKSYYLETHTDRQTGDLISLLLFLESRLKKDLGFHDCEHVGCAVMYCDGRSHILEDHNPNMEKSSQIWNHTHKLGHLSVRILFTCVCRFTHILYIGCVCERAGLCLSLKVQSFDIHSCQTPCAANSCFEWNGVVRSSFYEDDR
jgi:hypothetical protein